TVETATESPVRVDQVLGLPDVLQVPDAGCGGAQTLPLHDAGRHVLWEPGRVGPDRARLVRGDRVAEVVRDNEVALPADACIRVYPAVGVAGAGYVPGVDLVD